MTHRKIIRTAGWLAVAGLVGAALVAPAAVSANSLHQAPPISWDDPEFQGSEGECAGVELAPGQVLWHFVHTKTSSADLPSTIDALFGTGPVTKAGEVNGKSIVMYNLLTDETSLLGASDSIENDGLLNLSHICSNPQEQEEESQPTESQPTESQPTESQPTESQPTKSQPTESQSAESQPTETSTPEGEVEAVTGAPHVTPPPTDTTAATGGPATGSWQLLLLGFAGLIAGSLVPQPSAKRSGR